MKVANLMPRRLYIRCDQFATFVVAQLPPAESIAIGSRPLKTML